MRSDPSDMTMRSDPSSVTKSSSPGGEVKQSPSRRFDPFPGVP